MPKPATIRQARYDAAHTSRVGLKLHNDLDADILDRLAWAKDREGMQGYIKRLIRADIAEYQQTKTV